MEQKIKLICECLEVVKPGFSQEITIDSDLIKDGILDSLEAINFLFELENNFSDKIDNIDDDFNDFSVRAIMDLIK